MKKKIFGVLVLLIIGITVVFASCSKKVAFGVQTGTTGAFYFQDEVLDGKENQQVLRSYNQYAMALSDVKNGVIEGVIMDHKPAKSYVKNIGGLKIVDNVTTEEEFAFAVAKNETSKDLLNVLNKFLDAKKDEVKKITEQTEFNLHTIPVAQDKVNQIVMVTEAGFAPYELKVGDQYKGIDIEIGLKFVEYINTNLAVKQSLGYAEDTVVEFAIEDVNFDAIAPTVQADKKGKKIAMAGFTKNAEREKILNFTTSYDTNHLVLVVKEKNTKYDGIKTPEEFIAKFKKVIK